VTPRPLNVLSPDRSSLPARLAAGSARRWQMDQGRECRLDRADAVRSKNVVVTKRTPNIVSAVRSALGHAHPLVVSSSGDPVVDSVSASPLSPVAPVMPSIGRSLSAEDGFSSRAADAYAKPTRATAVFLVPDSQLDSAVQTDLLPGSMMSTSAWAAGARPNRNPTSGLATRSRTGELNLKALPP
jgi:hypothetical protein